MISRKAFSKVVREVDYPDGKHYNVMGKVNFLVESVHIEISREKRDVLVQKGYSSYKLYGSIVDRDFQNFSIEHIEAIVQHYLFVLCDFVV